MWNEDNLELEKEEKEQDEISICTDRSQPSDSLQVKRGKFLFFNLN